VANPTNGTVGAPNGLGTAISPSTSSASKPKYEMYGSLLDVSAIELPCPTSSCESTTNGTKRWPCP
jgi:hypothetical protein